MTMKTQYVLEQTMVTSIEKLTNASRFLGIHSLKLVYYKLGLRSRHQKVLYNEG